MTTKTRPMIWWASAEYPFDALGFLPTFLSAEDPRPAKEQFDERYVYGGFQPFAGFKFDPDGLTLKYPGDPELFPVAGTQLRDETILVYPHAWVAIVQKDDSVQVARMD